MTTDCSAARLNELLANGTDANYFRLQHLPPADAMDELSSTLLDYRRYCKDHKFRFLSHLLEMAVLESIEVRMSLGRTGPDKAKSTASSIPATHMEPQDESDDHNHDPR